MALKIEKAKREDVFIKIGIQGPSGSGKTYGALRLAKGLVGDLSKVCVIDTENRSSNLYAHLGDFSNIHLEPPFKVNDYVEAIKLAENNGFKCCIIDSTSHAWEFLLAVHSQMTGNSFTNWGKITPHHKKFVNAILQSKMHIISTIRAKEDYVLSEQNGRMVPEKVGLKGIQRDGLGYEFTLVFNVDSNHMATADKDRTSMFIDEPPIMLTEQTGKDIVKWCKEGIDQRTVEKMVDMATTEEELRQIVIQYKNAFPDILKYAQNKRKQINKEIEKASDVELTSEKNEKASETKQ